MRNRNQKGFTLRSTPPHRPVCELSLPKPR